MGGMVKRFFVLVLLIGTLCRAGFEVSPIRLSLTAADPVAVVEVKNNGQETKSFQLEPVGWTQDRNGSDRYRPTETLLAVPPIFTLGPGETQTVRVTELPGKDGTTPKAFRLYINEIPEKSPATGSSLRMVFRIGVPVFVTTGNPEKAALSLHGIDNAEGTLGFWLQNDAGRSVRINTLSLTDRAGGSTLSISPSKYLLAGSRARFRLEYPPAFVPVTVHVLLEDGQQIEMDL